MFIVFNRKKINSYLISVGTVAVLFVMAFMLTNNQTVQTGANTEEVQFNNEIKEERININNEQSIENITIE